MKRIVYSLSMYFLFCSHASAITNEEQKASDLRTFVSEILKIQEDTRPKTNERYRMVLQTHSALLLECTQNPKILEHAAKDKRLASFLAGKDTSAVHELTPMLVSLAACGQLQQHSCSEIPDEQIESLDLSINESVKEFKFSETTAVTMLLDPKEGVDLSDVPSALRGFLQLVLNKYFDALEVKTKRAILADVLLMDDDAPPEEVLAVILDHCGPVLQKAFQLFSKDVRSPKLNAVLNRLRQNIKPFPSSLAREIVEREAGISIRSEFVSFPSQPIAAATIGQVYLLRDRKGEKVIIKVQRPDVGKRAETEFKLLRSLTEDWSILNFIKDLEESFEEELDFEGERKNIKNAHIYDGQMRGKLKTVVEIQKYKSTSKVLFLSCADGQSIEKFGPETHDQKKDALHQLLYVWIHEAIFGSRIFHADLHPGNVFFAVDKEASSNYTLTLIDFGSMGSFSIEEARALFKILVGISIGNRQLAFFGLSSVAGWKEGVSESQILDLIDTLLKSDVPQFAKVKTLFDRSIELGILLPKSFLQFYRGESFIEKQITELYESEFNKEEAKLQSEKAITDIFRSVFKWDIFYDMWMTCAEPYSIEPPNAIVDNDTCISVMKSWFGY